MTLVYPLYDELCKMVDESQTYLDGNELKQLSSHITMLPLNILEIIYVLILHHFLSDQNIIGVPEVFLYCSKNKPTVPYKGTTFDQSKGVSYTLTNLPIRLQKIIYLFINLIQNRSDSNLSQNQKF